MAENENAGKLIWFVAGAAIGAAIALLYAPTSGKELRHKISEKTEEGRAALAERGHDVIERGRELYEKGRKLADDAADMLERGRKLVQG